MVVDVKREDRSLLPVFEDGELVEVIRTLPDGQRVVMSIQVHGASSLSPHSIRLNGRMKVWGVSPYADERVERQKESIERLLDHLRIHCPELMCGSWAAFKTERESNGSQDEASNAPAAPEQLHNPDDSGYQA